MRSSTLSRFGSVLALGLALPVALSFGCGPSDPLEEVRELQDDAGAFQASLPLLRTLLDERPDDPEVHYRYGKALIATGDVGLAVWSLRRAAESPSWLEEAGLALAAALIWQGAYDDAVAECERVLEQDADNVRALLLRANAHLASRRDYEQVLADANRVLDLDPDNTNALEARVVALLGLARVEEASVALEELEALHRDDTLGLHGSPPLCLARATFAKEKGEMELAEERFEACLEEFPTEPLVLNQLIAHFDGTGRAERSEAILSRALELEPARASHRMLLALRLAATDREDEAEALLRAGIDVAPPAQAVDAWMAVASFNVDNGDLEEGIAAYAKARELAGDDDPQLLLAQADALALAKRFSEAEEVVAKMKVPAHRAVVRGRIELERGDPLAALKLFEEGMGVWPDNAVVRYYAAIAAEQLGGFSRAIEEYRYAMRIGVRETDAYLRLARLLAASGRREAALETLEFQPGGRPEEVAAGLLGIRILAQLGRAEQMSPRLRALLEVPEHRGAAVAALGEGVRERSGSEAALAAMRAVKPLDLGHPIHSEALAAIVEDLAATGRGEEGLALADASLRKHPDAAPFLAIRGRALQLAGASTAPVREAFEAALALDRKNEIALLGLARLETEAGSTDAALALYDRSTAMDEGNRAAAIEAALLLADLGRSGAAEERLAAFLREHPYDAGAALALAELRLARGADDERTLELARRAVTFGGGSEAESLVERLAAAAKGGAVTSSSPKGD